MKNDRSILGLGVAESLLLDGFREVNGATFQLRRCSRKGIPSGGIICRACYAFPSGFSKLGRRTLRISSARADKARDILGRFATRYYREITIEKYRVEMVKSLDAMAAPLIVDKRFLRAMMRREKKAGISFYDKMTKEEIQDWIYWITNWKNRNGLK